MKAVLTWLTRSFCQYPGYVSSDAKSLCISLTAVCQYCTNFWVIFGHFGKDIVYFFLKTRRSKSDNSGLVPHYFASTVRVRK